MGFVLEKITEEIQQKILADAATCDHKKLLSLRAKGSTLFFHENLAINAIKNFYLYNRPIYFKTDGLTNSYYFYFHNKLYEIYIKGTFSGELV